MKKINFLHFNKVKFFSRFIILFLILILTPFEIFGEEKIMVPDKKNILVINSYSPNSLAIDEQLSGIVKYLGKDINLQVEYMDYGNFQDIENEDNFYNLLKYKIDKYKNYDLVILADDHAIEFGKKHGDTLFKDMPILFYGANDIVSANEFIKRDNTYGFIEQVPVKQSVDMISKLHNNKNIVAIVYESATTSSELKSFYSLQSEYENLNFKHISLGDMSVNKFREELEKLDDEDVLLSLYCYKDDNGAFKDMLFVADLIRSLDNVPMYNTLDFLLNDSFVGGYVLSSFKTGDAVGKVAKDILDNKEIPEKLIITDDLYQYYFSYPMLKKYNINESQLPDSAIITNKEASFWDNYSEIILPASVIIILLLITIIILILYLHKKVVYEKEIIKAKEVAENAAKIQSDFICNISHELRTPIAVIMSSNQLLEYKIKNNKPIEYNANVKVVQQNCYRLLRLVNNVIDIAKVDSGFMDLRLTNIEIISFIENLVLSIIPYASNRSIEVIFDTEEEEIYMCVDPDKIERIVLNLLSNAIKFSKENGTIHATVSKTDNKLLFSVEDNGVGIDEENLDKIFAKFSQIEDTMVRKNEGSGIGLSLVKSFITLHGGEIHVNSVINQGSIFIVELPIRILENESIYTYNVDTSTSDMLSTNIELSDIYL